MSSLKRLSYRLEAAGLRLLARLFRALGIDRASRFGGWAWRKVAPFTARHRRALTHLQIAFPEMTPEQHRALATAMWDNLGRTFAEGFHLDTIAAEPARVDISAAGPVADLASRTTGSVMVSLHMANWETAALTVRRFGLSPATLYRQVRNPYVDAMIRALREPWYPSGLYVKQNDDGQSALRLVGTVRRKGSLAVLADLRDSSGVEVPFFGQPALATPFPAMVARRFGVPLVAVRMRRTGGAHFAIESVEIPVSRTDDREADIREATAALHRVYEDWIRRDPGQWFWIHRKWAPPAATA